MSQTIKALLKEILRQKLQNQHAALLPEIIENAIDRRMRQHSSRQALLLVRAIFAGEQTRNLSTNILSRQPGVTPEVLNDILDRSAEAAKSKITQTTPQLEDLIAEVKSWFEKQEGEKADD